MTRAVLLVLLLSLCACNRGDPPAAPSVTTGAAGEGTVAPAPAEAHAPGELKDVVETTSDYVIGISFPPMANQYPGLAAEMRRYADAAREDLLEAVRARDSGQGDAMYDLSLSFTEVLDGPTLVAVAADGSSFTGGAHGNPLLARFVWLPREDKLLRATDLIPDAAGWRAVAAHVREQLHTALSQRVDADRLEPEVRAEVVGNASRLIDEGTDADPANYAHFEPVIGADGRIAALRFVFAPYEVGPYSDGVQTVQVPAAVLLPHVAPAYRDLFAAG